MRALPLLLLLVYAWTAVAEPVPPEAEITWVPWSPAVLAQARAEQRLVLLDLTADWCQFCAKMDATTYRDPRVIEHIRRHYVAVRIDDKDGSEAGQRYAGTGRPGTVVLDAEGNELIVKVGYLQPQWMVWLLEAVAAEPVAAVHRD